MRDAYFTGAEGAEELTGKGVKGGDYSIAEVVKAEAWDVPELDLQRAVRLGWLDDEEGRPRPADRILAVWPAHRGYLTRDQELRFLARPEVRALAHLPRCRAVAAIAEHRSRVDSLAAAEAAPNV